MSEKEDPKRDHEEWFKKRANGDILKKIAEKEKNLLKKNVLVE